MSKSAVLEVYLKPLIDKYKGRITCLQKQQKTFENTGRSGACISNNAEIQAYNAVISDLNKLISEV